MNAPSDVEWQIPGDEWAGLLLKARGELYLTDWSEWVDYGPDFFPMSPEIEVTKLLPEGSVKVGVLGDDGIFDVIDHPKPEGGFILEVIHVASWAEIEILPEWGAE
jgi:hypothetical protein